MKPNAEVIITEKIEQRDPAHPEELPSARQPEGCRGVRELKISRRETFKVILDRDLAFLYGVETRTLNQAVKRNIKRFPEDFMFQLSRKELSELITICDNLRPLKFVPACPYAFTEHGIAMLSSVLNSDKTIAINIQIMRTFGRLRELMLAHKDLRLKIEEMETKYDHQFKVVFNAIRRLLHPPRPRKPKLLIGFHAFQQADDTRSATKHKKGNGTH